ncbi:FAD-dependent oxidoreductase [Kineococcus sp. SYSU DK001]|uniref:FAD-dependent oxidoreductase n=1 Tax=Kineococcus sp. SYSU DK001 TaxID=3383122 RepID=UPI003D7E6C91
MTRDAEVGVLGLGAVGAATLRQLARRGVDVVGLERFWPVHDRGASTGESRVFRSVPYLERHEDDERLLAAAPAAWEELEAESGIEVLVRCGGLVIGRGGTPGVDRLVRLAGRREGVHVVDRAEAGERYPAHRLGSDDVVVADDLGGLLRPEVAVAAQLRTAAAAGARVVTGVRASSWEQAGDDVLVHTAERTYRFGRLVLAPGPWAPDLLPGLPVRPRRLLLTWFLPTSAQAAARYRPSCFPGFVRADGEVFLYGGPTLDGALVKVAGDDDWGYPATADALDRDVRTAELSAIGEQVARRLRGLSELPVRTSVHADGWSADGTAFLGRWPGSHRVVVATGFTGYGFKISPVVGRIAADLVTTGTTPFPIGHMDPARAAVPVG